MKEIIAALAFLAFSSSVFSLEVKKDASFGPLMSPKMVVCNDKNRPKMCPSIYRPVCALKKLDTEYSDALADEEASFVNEGSACMACGDPDVVAYYEGNCRMERSKVL